MTDNLTTIANTAPVGETAIVPTVLAAGIPANSVRKVRRECFIEKDGLKWCRVYPGQICGVGDVQYCDDRKDYLKTLLGENG